MRSRLITLLCAGASVGGCAHPTARRASEAGEVPFTLTSDNNVVVAATLNETDTLHLMLHTATSDVRLTEQAVRTATTLRFGGATEVGSWGGGGTSRVSAHNRLRIGGWRRDDVTVWEDKNSGRDTDGKFGLDFFDGKIVELDFDRHRLATHDRVPAKAARYERLKLEHDDGELFVSATCVIHGKPYTTKFLVHSGYAGGVLLADAFAAETGIDGRIAITERSTLADSFGNRIEVRKGVLPALALGTTELANVPVGFFSGGTGTQAISVIGGDVWKRFNLIFDVAHDALYLERRAS